MQSRPEKIPVPFGVFEKPLYYPTKRENKIKISEISVHSAFCWFVGIKEKNIRRSIGKNFSSPWREIAGRKGILICLVSEKRAESAATIALLVKPEKPKRPAGIVVLVDAAESVTFLEQVSTSVPNFAFRSFVPRSDTCWGCHPKPAFCGPSRRKIPHKYFFGFFKNSSDLHPIFLLSVRGQTAANERS